MIINNQWFQTQNYVHIPVWLTDLQQQCQTLEILLDLKSEDFHNTLLVQVDVDGVGTGITCLVMA